MSRKIFLAAVVGIAISLQHANAGDCSSGCESECLSCPSCQASCCELKVEESKKDKHCWKVECKEICIPNVVFPWQKSCCDPHANNGACVKKVKVLKKHKYTCPTCKYSWSPKACCGSGCSGGCDSGCASGCSSCSAGSSGEIILQNEVHHEGGVTQPTPATPNAESSKDVPPQPPAPSARNKNRKRASVAKFLRYSKSRLIPASLKKGR